MRFKVLTYEFWRRSGLEVSGIMATNFEAASIAIALAFVTLSGRNPTSFLSPAVFAILVLTFSYQGGNLAVLIGPRF